MPGLSKPRRRHPHAVRIDDALWTTMQEPAARARLDRSGWARGLIEDAVAGRIVIVPARLTNRLRRQARDDRLSVPSLVERLLEDALARRRR